MLHRTYAADYTPALPSIIGGLKDRGFRLVTVAQLRQRAGLPSGEPAAPC